MLCLASFSSLSWIAPLASPVGRWLPHDIEWLVLVVTGVLVLLLCWSIAAAGLALLCSCIMLLRALFDALLARWRAPVQLRLGPPEHAQNQAEVKLLPLSVKENRWAK